MTTSEVYAIVELSITMGNIQYKVVARNKDEFAHLEELLAEFKRDYLGVKSKPKHRKSK